MPEPSPLVQLHDADRRLAELDRRLAEIPAQLADLREAEGARRAARGDREATLQELADAMRHLEKDAQFQRDRLKKLQQRQMQVTDEQAMRAGEHEIAALQRKIESLEERLFEKLESQEIMERENQLRARGESEGQLALSRELAALEDERDACGRSQASLAREREAILARLGGAERRRYERVHARHGHSSLSALRDGACSVCGAKLPPQIALEIAHDRRVESCQNCGRLILKVEP